MIEKKERRVTRWLRAVVMTWIGSTSVLGAAWGLDLCSSSLFFSVMSSPVIFLVMCGLFLPDTAGNLMRRRGSMSDRQDRLIDLIGQYEWDSAPEDRDESLLNPRPRNESWNAVNGNEMSSRQHTITVFDMNSNGTYNATGTGTWSSGMHDL